MSYVPYHSGTTTPGDSVNPPSAPVYVTGELSAARSRSVLLETTRAAVPGKAVYRVRFHTQRYKPGHLVTLRNAVDGWQRDVFGTYQEGAWHFEFDSERYPHAFELKFVLNRQAWMQGDNVVLAPHRDHDFAEDRVVFAPSEDRYLHGYDNLRTEESQEQQVELPAQYREDLEYDVIIVGSGMGGGVLAEAVSAAGLRTLVLEAGSLLLRTHLQNQPGDWPTAPARYQVGNFVNVEGSRFLYGVHLNFGGRSVFWSGLIPRMRPWELASWPRPIADYLVRSGYGRAELLLRKRHNMGAFQGELVETLGRYFPDFAVSDLPRSRGQTQPVSGEPSARALASTTGTFSTADLLLEALLHGGGAGRESLTVNLNHLVTHVETDGSRATAIVCRDLIGNTQRRFRGKLIVLAAGSLESARIALRSRLRDPRRKVGVGLTDHPAYFSPAFTLPVGSPWGGRDVYANILLQHKSATSVDHPFNVEFLINPWFWDARQGLGGSAKDPTLPEQPSQLRLQFNFDSPLDDRNFVRLGSDPGKLEVKVHPNERLLPYLEEVQALRDEILALLQIPRGPADNWLHAGNEGTPHHAGGTLRMSDDHRGVVDTDLRFEGYDNLYVADLSVWPHIPAANPALTLAALALRLAGHLQERLR